MIGLLLALAVLAGDADDQRPDVLVVVGAEGTEEYGRQFRQWAGRWKDAADRGHASFAAIGLDEPGETSDRDLLKRRLEEEVARGRNEPLWLVFIGHGTFDGKTAKFNLRGPDVSSSELTAWLAACERPLAVINCASASGPFINELSGANRVVITATKSGFEHNFARFGDYLSAAIADPGADLDKDDETSLLEAFLLAAGQVRQFYESDARLATEHALIDDNGDRLGTPADWFRGLRATKSAKDGASLDGLRAGQFQLVASGRQPPLPAEARSRRDELEAAIARLRQQKGSVPDDEYYAQLEPLLVEIARVYVKEDGTRGE
ncbi:MAG TPA: hypothetical protein VG125_03620 [Pirellulales bacterium]|jgi:hypothetical protein|nr:hypothetical protein [Pirellulales bacterium]